MEKTDRQTVMGTPAGEAHPGNHPESPGQVPGKKTPHHKGRAGDGYLHHDPIQMVRRPGLDTSRTETRIPGGRQVRDGAVVITGEAIEKYLRDRFGESGVLVRDPDHPGWFREWNEEDTRELHQEVGEANGGEGQPPGPTGYT